MCKIDLCPMCKSKHNKNHKIISYNDKEYICNIHNEKYNSYCKECKKNICMKCEREHNNHERINYGDILPKENNIKELKEYIKIIKFK